MRQEIRLKTESAEATLKAGFDFASSLLPGDVVAFNGDLGSGKTVFIQGICQALRVRDYVTSPTYTLIQEYEGEWLSPGVRGFVTIFHFDFYRLQSAEEIEGLDLDGYFMRDGLCLIEWAERGETLLPRSHFSIRIDRVVDSGRILPDTREILISAPANRNLEMAA